MRICEIYSSVEYYDYAVGHTLEVSEPVSKAPKKGPVCQQSDWAPIRPTRVAGLSKQDAAALEGKGHVNRVFLVNQKSDSPFRSSF